MSIGAASRMMQRQIEGRGIHDSQVLTAIRKIGREAISQPYTVARMVETACLGLADRVLEIGCGIGRPVRYRT